MSPQTPLVRPKAYFERTDDAVVPGLVVFAAYVVGTCATIYAVVDLLFDEATNVPPEAERAVDRILPGTLVVILVTALIGLFLVAFIMHVFNSADATGEYRDAIAVAGWAYAPNALAIPITYLHTRTEIRGMSLDGSDPEAFQSQLEAAQSDGSGLIPALVLALVCAWSVYILAYGVAGTHDTSVDNTVLPAVGIGVGAFLLGL